MKFDHSTPPNGDFTLAYELASCNYHTSVIQIGVCVQPQIWLAVIYV